MKIQASTKKEFFESTGQWGSDLKNLDKFIRETIGEKSILCGGMGSITTLGYHMIDYTNSRGTQKWPLIAIASQKNYAALYVCAVDKNKQYLVEKYSDRLGKVSTGKSCVRFKNFVDIDQEVLKDLLEEAMNIQKPFG